MQVISRIKKHRGNIYLINSVFATKFHLPPTNAAVAHWRFVMHEDRYIRRKGVEALVGLSRSTIYQMIAEDRFPCPHRIGKRAVGFLLSEIEAWLRDRPLTQQGGR
jgi:prophage regulatory protein